MKKGQIVQLYKRLGYGYKGGLYIITEEEGDVLSIDKNARIPKKTLFKGITVKKCYDDEFGITSIKGCKETIIKNEYHLVKIVKVENLQKQIEQKCKEIEGLNKLIERINNFNTENG